MKRDQAAQPVDTAGEVLSNVQIDLTRPLTSSQVYSLGTLINKHVGEIYSIIASNCQESALTDVLDCCISQNQIEAGILEERFTFALNCEIDRFYQSGGVLIESDLTLEEISDKHAIINRNLDSFRAILKSYRDYAQTVNNVESFSSLYYEIYKNMVELYKRLAKFYCSESVSKAFEDMANIVEDGTYKVNI